MIPQQSEEVGRLRADVRRLAENHDQVVRWLRDKEAENERLREALGRVARGSDLNGVRRTAAAALTGIESEEKS